MGVDNANKKMSADYPEKSYIYEKKDARLFLIETICSLSDRHRKEIG